MNLEKLAILIILIGLPLFILLPEPNLDQKTVDLDFNLVSQKSFSDFSYVNFKTNSQINAQFHSNISIPQEGKFELQCQNNEFTILNVYG